MPTILIIDDDENSRDHMYRFLSGLDYSISLAAGYAEAYSLLGSQTFDVALVDVDLPDGDIRDFIMTGKSRDQSMSIIVLHADSLKVQESLGDSARHVFRVLQKPFYDAELNFQVKRALEERLSHGEEREEENYDETVNEHSEFVGRSPAIRKIFRTLGRVAKSDASVIILGETGTGKELIAWTIHKESLRSDAPFVRVNCAALPEQLLESELFGYEKGAFTGADKTRVGRFEHANGGTIFLDEVADMSLVTQSKILRVLQQKEFERLGSNISIKTDVRILSATNKNLMEMMRDGSFREDLFYRLNVITIRLPPLRERGGDIGLLLLYFLKRYTAKLRKHIGGFKPDAMEKLTRYPWPGNIREMENTLERAVLLAEGDMICIDDLDLIFADETMPATARSADAPARERRHAPSPNRRPWEVFLPAGGISLQEAERQLIEQALERCGGSQKKAAELLGVSGRVLSYKLMNMRQSRGMRISRTA